MTRYALLRLVLAATCITAWLASAAMAEGIPERVPPHRQPTMALPRVIGPLALDGDLTEWKDAPCLPLRSPNWIVRRRDGHAWRGPADASLEAYAGWTTDGICLAAVVADDDVLNAQTTGPLYRMDSVELFVDGRVGDQFMNPRFTRGAYQITVAPPSGTQQARVTINRRDGAVSGLKAGGKLTATGYTVEVLVPWSAFPGLQQGAGASVAILCGLNEYDRRDGAYMRPLAMTYDGERSPWEAADRFVRCRLTDASSVAGASGAQIAVDVRTLVTSRAPLSVAFDLGATLSAHVAAVKVQLCDTGGKARTQKVVRPTSAGAPWSASLHGSTAFPPPALDGVYRVRVSALDASGRALGTNERNVVWVAGTAARTMKDAYVFLRSVDVARLAQKQPFRATACLGLGVCVERLKRGVELGDLAAISRAAGELAARKAVLTSGKTAVGARGMLDLLNLEANPVSQVVVDVSDAERAVVTFVCGSVPVASVSVSHHESAQAAAREVAAERVLLAERSTTTTVNGLPARLSSAIWKMRAAMFGDMDPARQVAVVDRVINSIYLIDSDHLDLARVPAALVAPGCSEAVRAAVTAWAGRSRITLISAADAGSRERFVIAGDPLSPEAQAATKGLRANAGALVTGISALTVAKGARVIRAETPSAAATRRAVELVLRGTAVSLREADGIRAEIVKAVASAAPASGGPDAPFLCGDQHMHTFHSDGIVSPAALALEAMRSHLDYIVMTDHNTIGGGQLAVKLLGGHGFAYPITVGEEVTTDWAHLNAYPLAEHIPETLPLAEIVSAAHRQGAVIQWNHPGFPGSPWDSAQQKKLLDGTGLDAWEHWHPSVDEWKAAGKMPALTGGTDTHEGTFSLAERTLLFAPDASGASIADAVRSRRVAMWSPDGGRRAYGPDDLVARFWSALANGSRLRAAKAGRIRRTLAGSDLVGLLQASPAKP